MLEVLEEIPKGLGVREPLDRLRSSAGAAERQYYKLLRALVHASSFSTQLAGYALSGLQRTLSKYERDSCSHMRMQKV